MSRTDRAEFRHRDIPQLEGINLNAQSGAGAGADYEHVIVTVPDLSKLALTPSGYVGALAPNHQQIRLIMLAWEANLTGAATNNVVISFNQRRAGVLLVNTTVTGGATGTGLVTITPASMNNIFNGMQLQFSQGTAEIATVFNVTTTTFQVNLVNTHTNGSAIVSIPLATITYASGTNDLAFIPRYFTPTPHFLKPGDIVTMQRFSNGSGLATPPATITLDWMNFANAV